MNDVYVLPVEYPSGDAFAPTVARLIGAIEAAGMTVFAEIDHAAEAQSVGMTMNPATVLIYGNPRGGTPVMQAVPQLALDLPLRVLVRADLDSKVSIAFHPVGPVLRQAGVPEAVVLRLEGAQRLLVDAIASTMTP